jgi:hypothetical protein
MHVKDVGFAPGGGIWLAGAVRSEGSRQAALWFQRSRFTEPENVAVKLDATSRVRFAAGRLRGAQLFEEFSRVEADSPALVLVGDSPNLFDFPVSYAMGRREDGLFSGRQFSFPTAVVATSFGVVVVTAHGGVTTFEHGARIRARDRGGSLAALLAGHFPDSLAPFAVSRADALEDGRVAIIASAERRNDSLLPGLWMAQAVCVSPGWGAPWSVVATTRPDRGEPTFADVSWLR